jgi:hypothetical protein
MVSKSSKEPPEVCRGAPCGCPLNPKSVGAPLAGALAMPGVIFLVCPVMQGAHLADAPYTHRL